MPKIKSLIQVTLITMLAPTIAFAHVGHGDSSIPESMQHVFSNLAWLLVIASIVVLICVRAASRKKLDK